MVAAGAMMPHWLESKSDPQMSRLSNDAPIQSLRYVVLDTELTSLDHRKNRLLSIGAIIMQGPSIQLGEQFYRVVNPQVPIPAETVVIHKFREEDIKEAEAVEPVLNDFRQLVAGAVLVGHFLDIDLKVLRKEMLNHGHQLDNPAIDTAKVHHWLLKRGPLTEDVLVQLGKVDLASVASAYRINVEDAHHALTDAFLTARIWQKMLYSLQANRVESLRELLRIGSP